MHWAFRLHDLGDPFLPLLLGRLHQIFFARANLKLRLLIGRLAQGAGEFGGGGFAANTAEFLQAFAAKLIRLLGSLSWRVNGLAALGGLNRGQQSSLFSLRMRKPFHAPQAIDLPPQTFHHLLPQAIPIARGAGTIVFRPVTFDAEQVGTGLVGVKDSQINEKTGRAHFHLHLMPGLS